MSATTIRCTSTRVSIPLRSTGTPGSAACAALLTRDRFYAVTHVSTSISLIACLLMAVTGFVVFTDKTQVGDADLMAYEQR